MEKRREETFAKDTTHQVIGQFGGGFQHLTNN